MGPVLTPMLRHEKQQQHASDAQRQAYEREIAALTTRLARLESRT